MREKQEYRTTTSKRVRITPACAGKTPLQTWRFVATRDHPRVCGKNNETERAAAEKAGSPPRVREKPVIVLAVYLDFGITPACAGKTLKGPNEIKTFLSF